MASAATATSAMRAPRDRPNIVLVYIDDLGYGDFGYTGHPTTKTPNIDRMAYEGRVLSTWYSASPVCTASRTALMTGRQPPRVGMPGVINSLNVEGLPLNETTLATLLHDGAGYRTMAIGKWHLGQRLQYLPANRGFDEFYGLPFSVDDGTGFASTCAPHSGADDAGRANASSADAVGLGPQLPLPLIHQLRPRNRSATHNVSSLILNQPTNLVPLTADYDAAIGAFFARWFPDAAALAANPFFLYLAASHVHTATPNIPNYEQYAGCPFVNTTVRGRFGDALAEIDWLVGRVVAHVEELGVANNTLFIVTSDNGPWLMKNQGAGSMGLFTGVSAGYSNTGKGSTWEGGVREPALVYWPHQVPAHTRTSTIVSSMDVLPTLLGLAGVPLPADRVYDGQDARAVWLGTEDDDDAQEKPDGGASRPTPRFLPLWNNNHYGDVFNAIYACRYGRFKAHFITSAGLTPGHPAPLTTHDPPLVFDVEADPSEAYPLSEADGTLPAGTVAAILAHKADAEASLFVRSINMTFGDQWALCCSWATQPPCHCNTPTVIPMVPN